MAVPATGRVGRITCKSPVSLSQGVMWKLGADTGARVQSIGKSKSRVCREQRLLLSKKSSSDRHASDYGIRFGAALRSCQLVVHWIWHGGDASRKIAD
jgi:hypothetical protein